MITVIDLFQAFENFSKLYDFAEVFGFVQIVLMLLIAFVAIAVLVLNVLFARMDEIVSFVSVIAAGGAIASASTALSIIAVMNYLVFPHLMSLFWV